MKKLLLLSCTLSFCFLLQAQTLQKKLGPTQTVPAQPAKPGTLAHGAVTKFTGKSLHSTLPIASNNPTYSAPDTNGVKVSTTMLFNRSLATSLKPKAIGVPAESLQKSTGETPDGMLCDFTNVKVSLSDDSFMSVGYAQQAANLYPGAVYTFDNFFKGKFNQETAPRNPIRIVSSVTGMSGDVFEDVENPGQRSMVSGALNRLHQRLPSKAGMMSYKMKMFETSSANESLLKLGVGASYYGASMGFSYSNQKSSEQRHFMIDATQEMYTLDTEIDQNGIFLNASDAQKPYLMLMGTVTYGHRVLVSIDASNSSATQAIGAHAGYNGGVVQVQANIESLLKSLDASTTVKMYVIGGENPGFITLDKNQVIQRLNQYFRTASVANAQPIRYQFRNMNNEVLRSESATDFFPTRQCIPDEGARIKNIRATLLTVTNMSDPEEEIKLGIRQVLQASLPNGDELKDMHNDGDTIICWWEGARDCEAPAKFKGVLDLNRSRSYQMSQGDIQNGAKLTVDTKYFAMYATKAFGSTNSATTFVPVAIPLSNHLTSNGSGGGNEVNVPINFEGRRFVAKYSIQITD